MIKRLTILALALILFLGFSTIATAKINIETDEHSNLRYVSNKKFNDVSGLMFVKTMKYKKSPVYMIEFVGPVKNWLSTISEYETEGSLALGIDTSDQLEYLTITDFSLAPIGQKTWFILLHAQVTQEQIDKIINAKKVFYSVGALGYMPLTPPNGVGIITDDDLDEWKRVIEMEQ